MFRGKNHIDQLTRIIQIMGTPKEEDIKAATSEGKNFVLHGVAFSPGIPFDKLFPNATPLARELLKNMLHFNPYKRFTTLQALKHPYFKNIFHNDHIQECPTKFDFSFEEETKKKGIKEVCYETVLKFNSDKKLKGKMQQATQNIKNPTTNNNNNNSTSTTTTNTNNNNKMEEEEIIPNKSNSNLKEWSENLDSPIPEVIQKAINNKQQK
jgi:serine/threonine protein kinase